MTLQAVLDVLNIAVWAITVVLLAYLALQLLDLAGHAARAGLPLLRFFCAFVLSQAKRAWRRDVNILQTLKRWLRGHIVVQVLAVEPGDVLLVNFAPGVIVDAEAMANARLSIEAVLRAVRGQKEGRGIQVVVGKGMDVSVVRQVLPDVGKREGRGVRQ